MTGQAVAAVLTRFGATPTVCDDDPVMLRPHAERGLPTVSSSDAVQQITGYALVVASPGFSPATPLLAAAAAAGVPIWGDVELAWRLDAAGCYGPPRSWLVVTGTNGKTTTTSMLHAMLIAGGRRAVLCGNIGSAVLDVLDEPAELLAVELSSFQLHWAPSLRPEAGAVLNIAEDHLDWHATMAEYTAAKARVLTGYPEAVLARELELCYAAIALVTDVDAGVAAGDGVKAADVFAAFGENIELLKRLVRAAIDRVADERTCTHCQHHAGVPLPFELP